MTPSHALSEKKLRILCLHGYTQSGPLFRSKTRALEKNLQKHFPASPKPGHLPAYPGGVEFVYLTAPIKLQGADIPTFDSNTTSTSSSLERDGEGQGDGKGRDGGKGDAVKAMGGDEAEAWGWWVKRTEHSDTPSAREVKGEKIEYVGLEQSVELWARTIREQGPFDGVLGFSQGGAAAVMLASLLEEGRGEVFERGRGMAFPRALVGEDGKVVQRPLKVVVVYSGFRAPEGMGYDAFYEGGLKTPSLHFIGSVDTVVEESRCLAVLDACRYGNGKTGKTSKNGVDKEAEERHRLVYHPGGHFVPSSQKPSVNAVVQFIRDVVRTEQGKGKDEEESVEDMDVPF
ncbi:Serine hydrolase (FSH1)-like protein 1 [Elsinoe fawcettii]|nr:Serine hydrolase (FSH1)-like protein 1 [Elsinoe fawcettii]